MAELTIAKARDSFSSLVAELVDGRAEEHLIKRRGEVVAKLVAVRPEEGARRVFGAYRDDPMLLDDDLFDSLDGEIADEFGV